MNDEIPIVEAFESPEEIVSAYKSGELKKTYPMLVEAIDILVVQTQLGLIED